MASTNSELAKIRKLQHIELCASQDVEASDRFTGFSQFHFVPQALPRLNMSQLQLSQEFLGQTFAFPFFITGMTGGIEKGALINQRLAAAASHFQIPMGVGSQRIALEDSNFSAIFKVKDRSPNLFLIGNIGGSQLAEISEQKCLELCKRAVDMIQADALAIHLNLIQECIQAEGSPQFSGLLDRIAFVCSHLGHPVIVKEVGSGISPSTCLQLKNAQVSAIDLAGKGGTSWAYIEGLRSSSQQSQIQRLGELFRNWGIPTAYNIAAVRKQDNNTPIIATGGIRDGLTAAKALALGCNMVGIGLPLLRAALESEERLHQELEFFIQGLKITMLATDCTTPKELSQYLHFGLPFADEWIP